MSDHHPELMEKFSVPEKCRNCPVLCDIAEDLAQLLFQRTIQLEQVGMLLGEEDKLDAEIANRFTGLTEDEIENAKVQLRQAAGADMELTDTLIDAFTSAINENTEACSGVLNMRATKGAVYTVTVCTSPQVYGQEGENIHASAHIKRVEQ